jgi:uncharacterized protein (DUF433 family)
MRDYIEQRNGGYYFIGSRISLDSIVYPFLSGESPETIAQSFPSLSLEQVYAGITFYLSRRQELDAYLKAADASFEQLAKDSRETTPELYARLKAMRRCTPTHS